jgi:hypothetical protein
MEETTKPRAHPAIARESISDINSNDLENNQHHITMTKNEPNNDAREPVQGRGGYNSPKRSLRL